MGRSDIVFLILVGSASTAVQAQSLAKRVAAAPDGKVAFTFAGRPGVCGDGHSFIRDGHHFMTFGNHSMNTSEDDDDSDNWNCPCDQGPVRVTLDIRSRKIAYLKTTVGGKPASSVTDLGVVGTAEAVDYLLTLAEKQGDDAGNDAILPATLADSVSVWPRLLRLAKNDAVAHETRRTAVFWVSQAAGEAATRGLDSLATDEREDRDIREQAVFALSQRPREEGVPALIRIAGTNKDPEVRKKALFWLGQSEDPRALALFEEILTKR
jgi:hypothetical protein